MKCKVCQGRGYIYQVYEEEYHREVCRCHDKDHKNETN